MRYLLSGQRNDRAYLITWYLNKLQLMVALLTTEEFEVSTLKINFTRPTPGEK